MKYVNESQNEVPLYKKHNSDAGQDVKSDENVWIPPGSTRVICSRIRTAPPHGTYGKLFTRSSMAKKGVMVVGGVIDREYRGWIYITLNNTSWCRGFMVNVGDRIAQLVTHMIYESPYEETTDLNNTVRGDGGFGSTGV